MGCVDEESGGEEEMLADRQKIMRKIQNWVFDRSSNLNSNLGL